MKSKITAIVCLVLIACGCGRSQHYPRYEFGPDAVALKGARIYWVEHGRPADFQPGEVAGPADRFFIFTNAIRTTNGVFHCRFGAREDDWPPGVLAITDEGLTMFIARTNGKVTISPEEYGVDYP